jgi:hypothetical protein
MQVLFGPEEGLPGAAMYWQINPLLIYKRGIKILKNLRKKNTYK